ncbi:N-acetylmuramic acid 6-phosphate etherase [Mycoplasma procyoni]|uniref:N-acetylmuramic acid 6-phosphate etherase n=1 Tax=Mycoplasma procyoni TaxID=568784 RepID=UPI00197B82EB|nr:N-acetylmuramic acid 6-phosphate etherase [Mycoplasma procyoni]MBN3534691.1 N-acetylmuramic acid 6-phosphate etherase [Mycoplasma procyoni]
MRDLDKLSTQKLIELFNETTNEIHKEIKNKKSTIYKICSLAIKVIKRANTVFYVGAGTSGRIGLVDALDFWPTFNEKNWFKYSIAGGDEAVLSSLEQNEDNFELGISDVFRNEVKEGDLIIGLSASANTKYVNGFLSQAKRQGCHTVLITNKAKGDCYENSDIVLFLDLGDELIEGSTRLKAATAQKIVLNTISSITAIKHNKVYENMMVEVNPINEKLVKRSIEIIKKITACEEEVAKKTYFESEKNIKLSCIIIKKEVDLETAKKILRKNENNLRKALEDDN